MIAFRGYTHLLIVIFLLGWLCITDKLGMLVVFFILLGAILPDIDYPESILGKLNPFVWMGLMNHRGFSHTIPGMLFFCSLAIYLFGWIYSASIAAGYLLHLISDTFTPKGIKWLYPFKQEGYSLAHFPTGGVEEAALFIALLCLFFSH